MKHSSKASRWGDPSDGKVGRKVRAEFATQAAYAAQEEVLGLLMPDNRIRRYFDQKTMVLIDPPENVIERLRAAGALLFKVLEDCQP